MSSGRRNARRQAVFLLYQQDLLQLTPEAALARAGTDEVPDFARQLVLGVNIHQASIDRMLTEHVAGWSLERLGMLERAILRTSVFELLWDPEIPDAVAIDEAVVLAKRFCSPEAGALVNGVLGSLSAAHFAENDGDVPSGVS